MSEHIETRQLEPAKPIRLPALRNKQRERSLTRRQERFVEAYLDCGVISRAAQLAGYSAASAAVRGQEALQSPTVIEAMHKRLEQRVKVAAPIAFNRLMHLAQHAESENVSLQASVALLDRAGYSVIRKIETTHLHDVRSDGELAEAAKALVSRLRELNLQGIDAKPLIDVTPGATDVEADQAQSTAYEQSNDEQEGG